MPLVELSPDDGFIPLQAPPALAELSPDEQVQGAYKGSILPMSRDAQGNTSFDLGAGLLAALVKSGYAAARAPGDVLAGKLPIMTETGQYNPDMINRAIDFAGMFAASPAPGGMPTRQLRATPPTAEELQAAGSAGYNAARGAGLELNPQIVTDTGTRLANDLTRRGFGAEVAPQTHAILDRLATPPSGPGVLRSFTTMDDLEAIRRNFSNLAQAGGSEGGAARRAVGEIDRILETLTPADVVAGAATGGTGVARMGHNSGPPLNFTQEQLDALAATQREARANYATSFRANDISGELDRANTGIRERAGIRTAATHSGQNLDNALRQRVASFLEKPDNVAGYSQAEIAALNDFVNPGLGARNAARYSSNLLGGGGGLGSGFVGSAATGLGSYMTGNPAFGMAIGLGAPALGYGLKQGQNALASRALNQVEEMIRMRSPLGEQMQAAMPHVPDLRDIAALRLLLLGGANTQPFAPFGMTPPQSSIPQAMPGFI